MSGLRSLFGKLSGFAGVVAGGGIGGGALPMVALLVALGGVASLGSCVVSGLKQQGADAQIRQQLIENNERERQTAKRQITSRAALAEIDRRNARRYASIQSWLAVLEAKIDALQDTGKPGVCPLDCKVPRIEEWDLIPRKE